MSKPNALQCRDVRKSFLLEDRVSAWRILFGVGGGERFHALKGVTLDVPKGQFVGLLGRNGAGKSTLLRTIGGVYAPDSGVVVLSGDMSGIYELGLTGNEHLTGRAFAHRWLEVFSSRDDSRTELVEDILDFSELGESFDRPIRTYSSGMKSRLFFAMATARKSHVYIIDEVLSVGDEYFQNKCWRRIRQRLGGGASGLIATHDWSAIMRLCPSSYIIDSGEISAQGPSSQMVREYLQLSPDSFAEGAKFAATTPETVAARALEDFRLRVDIDATIDVPLYFGAAVEVFVAGYGWEHVLHGEPREIGRGPGRLSVEVSIPRLPLNGGAYSLGLFLSLKQPGGSLTALDARSWTFGQGIDLVVEGPVSSAAARWPVAWLQADAVKEPQ